MIEASIEDWIVDKAEQAGWLVRKLNWIGRRGAPDRLFAKGGRIVLMELKRPGGDPSANQVRELDRLHEAGIEAYLVESPLEALRVLGVPHA